MRLRTLTLVSFRNYLQLTFEPHPACTVLCGRNGQGKTNILEAIGLLATGRSHRGARDRDLTQWDAQGYRLDAACVDGEGELRTVLVYDGVSKRAECDGVPQERLSTLLGRLPLSVFAPDDLAVVKGGPQGRRRLLDLNLSVLSSAYLTDLQVYTRVLRQRNRAVQDWVAGRASRDVVELWDAPLAESGSRLQIARAHYVAAIAVEAAAVYATVSGGREKLSVLYRPSIQADGTAEEIYATFLETLHSMRARERGTKATPCGPHRDDVELCFNEKAVREFGSQGQQRSVVLALKLAESAVLQQRSPTAPITLLDDFASELDEEHQAGILDTVRQRGQVIITTTELTAPLRAIKEKQVYRVEAGTVSVEAA